MTYEKTLLISHSCHFDKSFSMLAKIASHNPVNPENFHFCMISAKVKLEGM